MTSDALHRLATGLPARPTRTPVAQPAGPAPSQNVAALTLIAATQRRWIADDLRAGAPDGVEVRHDQGLDAPDVPGRCAWWTPAAHAARLQRGGIAMNLSAPGPGWLAALDVELLGRRVWAGPLSEIADAPRAGFAKPAEAKVDGLPAAWWDDTTHFAAAAGAAGMDDASWVQVADRRLALVEEHRCFVLDGAAGPTSPYLDADGNTYEIGWEHDGRFDHTGAHRFAGEAAAELADTAPRAYTLDVARCADGTWVVLEANPAWCSGFYGCAPTSVTAAVVASSDSDADHGAWVWRPDSYLVAHAASTALLRPWVPAWARVG